MEKLFDNICRKTDLRATLIALRQELKKDGAIQRWNQITHQDQTELMKCLAEPDAKVRKNAALLLGQLQVQDALEILMDAYEAEDQLFVKAHYVKAMSMLHCREKVGFFQKRLQELSAVPQTVENKKHLQAEIYELQQLLLSQGATKKHTFCGYDRKNEIVLTTLNPFRDMTAAQIKHCPVKRMTGGLRMTTCDLEEIMKIRTFRDLLFVIHGVDSLPEDPVALGKALWETDLMDILTECHKEEGPFFFRLGVPATMPLDLRSVFAKKASAELELASGRQLVNSPSHYEVEIRLIAGKDGGYRPYLKLHTLADHRFDYRRYHVSSSMQPFIAAGVLELVKPFLIEHAQVLDPFCGSGTLLIERNYQMPARDCYGIDIFGEAVEKARMNSKIAKMQTIHYVNRDFFQFRHEYLFDEIITNMPVKGGTTYEELDALYQKFFKKAKEHMHSGSIMILYSDELGFVKKQLRIQKEYHLLKEICISEKNRRYVFVISL